MGIDDKQVEHVAKLARLELSEKEKELFGSQLSAILEHAENVSALDTQGVVPTSHSVPLLNVMRPDVPHEPLQQAEALANAPVAESGHFRVPRIMEGE
ncbi:MAG: Asp-tRNA(Asn)/Glu-tRNA(Gln) amidotransferase subunit GatC [Actinobacteria bacterium]|nr:Asp-tRNA(Asn)/Glu-tRNA(Gln) amidotransferase subunit GatC [Actinomycetota bacterium]